MTEVKWTRLEYLRSPLGVIALWPLLLSSCLESAVDGVEAAMYVYAGLSLPGEFLIDSYDCDPEVLQWPGYHHRYVDIIAGIWISSPVSEVLTISPSN
jgi:hypothetical protein